MKELTVNIVKSKVKAKRCRGWAYPPPEKSGQNVFFQKLNEELMTYIPVVRALPPLTGFV